MGICTAVHPSHWGPLQTIGTGAEGRFHSGPIPGHQRGNTRKGSHPSVCETGGTGPPRPEKNGPWELDGVLCYHRRSCHSAQRPEGFTNGGSFCLPLRGESRGVEAECPTGREALVDTLTGPPVKDARCLCWVTKMVEWLTVLTSMITGAELGPQEWHNDLFLWYGLEPPDLSK